MRGDDLIACASCSVCEGSGYQTVPLFATGNLDATVLVLGPWPQNASPDNPAYADATTELTDYLTEKASLVEDPDPAYLNGLYSKQLRLSKVGFALQQVLGDGWTEKVTYSPIIRCRVPENPTREMFENCRVWTMTATYGKKGIVFLGPRAAAQVLGETAEKLPPNSLRPHPQLGWLLQTVPVSAWDSSLISTYKGLFFDLFERIAAA